MRGREWFKSKTVKFRSENRSRPSYTGYRSLVGDSLLWIYSLTKRFYWGVNIFMRSKLFSCPSWNKNVKYTWQFLSGASVIGWSGTKKSFSKIHPTKGQSSQHYKPRALARMQCDGKTNSLTGKRKTFIWDVKKGPPAGNTYFHLILQILVFLHVLPWVTVGYIFFFN